MEKTEALMLVKRREESLPETSLRIHRLTFAKSARYLGACPDLYGKGDKGCNEPDED